MNTTLPAPSQTTLKPLDNAPSYAEVDLDMLPAPVRKLLAKKGQYCRIVSNRPLKVRKGRDEIIKHSEFTVRIGVSYDALKSTKEGREDGTLPSENQGMWGEWVIFPILKKHKENHYIRCTAVNGNDNCIPKTSFHRNGVEISRDEAKIDALASEFAEKDLTVFDIKVESIESVNGEPI